MPLVNSHVCDTTGAVLWTTWLQVHGSEPQYRVLKLESLRKTSPTTGRLPAQCTLRLQTQLTEAQQLLDSYDDAPGKIKWDCTTSPIMFSRECTENKQILNEIEKIRATKCENQQDVLDLNEEVARLYTSVGYNIGVHPNKVIPHTGTVRTSRKSNIKTRFHQKWVDSECIAKKIELKRAEKKYVKKPTDDGIRSTYYAMKKEYRKFIKSKKMDYFKKLGEHILQNNSLSWESVKKLQNESKPHKSTLDIFDLNKFYSFFKDLYKEKQLNFPRSEEDSNQYENADQKQKAVTRILNEPITLDELSRNIKNLKSGKAIGLDSIANEFLKASGRNLLSILLKLFNECLDKGIYPWNDTVITPLHKKGDIYNPDNYRAIAVGSNIGKLFSAIMLQRLIEFRNSQCPDTSNQLGFCRNAQTADHLFSLHTCIEKYVKYGKQRLFSCFVDFKKAFDTVCREALLYKLGTMGIEGKFFNCITHMYNNSKARIKIINKLSQSFEILCGTEQGHPASPELFKMYIHELSVDLNNMTNITESINVPVLNGQLITHLLWADDLVLLACDKKSLQRMIDKLQTYCDQWGLEVSIKNDDTSKTAVMIFNTAGRQLKESYDFKYGETDIPSVKTYTYLGIIFTLSGSLKHTQHVLRQKGLRAYFGMKRYVDLNNISKMAAFKLYDALVQPVANYGCQIWLPTTEISTAIIGTKNPALLMSHITSDPLERLHLSFLKWTLGVPKQTSNAAVYGDSGRTPTVLRIIKQFVSFINRLSLLDRNDSQTIVRHAFAEQKKLKLPWYFKVMRLTTKLDPRLSYAENHKKEVLPNALLCQANAKDWFNEVWSKECQQNRKLRFYNDIKDVIRLEPYLTDCSHKSAKLVARIRSSSHRLNIESGRYGTKSMSLHNRCCPTCTDQDALEYITALPGQHDPIIEDERHVLEVCPLYKDIRLQLQDGIRQHLHEGNMCPLFEHENVKTFANYVKKILNRRFPEYAPKF